MQQTTYDITHTAKYKMTHTALALRRSLTICLSLSSVASYDPPSSVKMILTSIDDVVPMDSTLNTFGGFSSQTLLQ